VIKVDHSIVEMSVEIIFPLGGQQEENSDGEVIRVAFSMHNYIIFNKL
jgi:hypothetical protein